MKILGFPSFWLPEDVIQHIQSFMSGREAVQTSILSKSWHTAWSTRPNLDFSQLDFGRDWESYTDVGRFLESSKKTMQRYEQSNLRIKSFRLSMDMRDKDNCVIADELIARALKMGAIKLALSRCLECSVHLPPLFLTTNAWDLRKLKFLHLEQLDIDPLFSSREFPSLKVLTLDRCHSGKGEIRISGPSLERLSFARTYFSRVALDVPNIRKFTFSSRELMLPSLVFEATTSMDWVSDLSIVFGGNEFKASWFLELEKFLDELSQSKISLYIELESGWKAVFDYARDNQCLCKPAVVEKLTVKLHGQYINADNNLLEYLFRSVEPKLITQSWEDLQRQDWLDWSWERNGDKFLKLFCNAFKTPSLEEVFVECFEETLAEWQPSSFKTLLDASTYLVCLDYKKLIRFRLKWRV